MTSRAEKLLAPFLASDIVRPNGDMDMYCPFHEDGRRSATVNFRTQQWFCFSCDRGGGLQVLLKQKNEWREPSSQTATSRARRSTRHEDLPDPARVDGWHSALASSPDRLEWFEYKRGITLETLRKHNIGWDGSRYTIPVYDEKGEIVNIRRYSPGGEPKVINWPGHGSPARLYPLTTLMDNPHEVIFCEGEFDTIYGLQEGVHAITSTSGVRTRWRDEWSSWFEGRVVYLCLDRDKEGRRSSRKLTEALSSVASEVRVIDLPYPFGSKKDLTDYFLDGGTASRLIQLAKSDDSPEPERASGYEPVEYEDLRRGEAEGKPVEITGTLASVFSTQILLPDALEAKCNFDWDPKRCAACPVNEHGGNLRVNIPEGADLHLELFTIQNVEARNKLFKKALGAPERCPRVAIEAKLHSAWDCEIRNGSNLAEEAFPVVLKHEGKPPVLNHTYKLRGKLRVSPRGQRAVFMASSLVPAKQDLDSFEPDDFGIRRANEWRDSLEGEPDECLEQIAEQLEYHCTEIYGQRLLHIAIDLVYHSVLRFPFGGSNVSRGWMEALAVGETRSGKSTAIQKIQELYSRGHYQSAENATIAGLLFGVDKRVGMGRETWGGSVGVLPLNNRGLVAIDEAQGLRTEQIAQMSDMRSRGIVQVSKIRSVEVEAAVRLIWLANGRRSNYARGIDALRDQMGQAEDLARVDIPLYILGDIGAELDKKQKTYGPMEWPPSVLQWILIWAWSRKPDHIEWTRKGLDAIWTHSKELSRQFTTSIPIFQPNEAGVRLARMSAAVAARLFSTPDGHKLVIDEPHVAAAARLYERFLGAEELGIREIKEREQTIERSGDENSIELKDYLRSTPPSIRQMLASGMLPASPNPFGTVDMSGNIHSKFIHMNAIVLVSGGWQVSKWAVKIARELDK
jgi:hypothetical protein